jgi:hypothetical protein
MAPTLYHHPGTRLSDFGNLLRAILLEPLSAIPTTCFPFPSPQTIDRSSQDRVTGLSSYGTLWATANSPSQTRVTPNGSHVFDSLQTLRILSLLVLDGINLSRWVHVLLQDLPMMLCNFIKYLLLQSLLAMRQITTGALRHLIVLGQQHRP